MPERWGIRTSIRITSGMVSWAFWTASFPSPASPTTSMSFSCLRTIWRPRRKRAWSSTIKTFSLSASALDADSLATDPPAHSGDGVIRIACPVRTSLSEILDHRSSLSAISELLSVPDDLPLQPLDHLVERRVDVLAGPRRPKDMPGRVTRHLHPVAPVDPGVVLLGDLDLQPPHPWLEAFDLGSLVFRGLSDLIRYADAPALEDEVHRHTSFRPRSRRCETAPAWLTWSLAPHSPAEGFAAEEAV